METNLRGEFSKCDERKNLVSFWFLGLCNNFAYVVMLSAAYDILKANEKHADVLSSTLPPPTTTTHETISTTSSAENNSCPLVPECNHIGTGAILLADIIPTLVIKLTAPFYMQKIPYIFRVAIVVLFSTSSFPIVSTSQNVWTSLLGVVFASIGCGFGEITFLSLSAHYDGNVISTWSSGTGMAGVAGSLSYLGLTAVGVSPRNTLFILMVVPLAMILSYALLVKPRTIKATRNTNNEGSEQQTLITTETVNDDATNEGEISEINVKSNAINTQLTIKDKFSTILHLLKYMIPLGMVYFAEYFINQALFELLLFEDIWLSFTQQYRWYQVIYQIGVLISRSSVNIFHTKKTWIFPILQFINLAILLFQIFFNFIPYIWIVFIIILWEGLLGGAGYVNTFYTINEEEPDLAKREFSQGVASVSDSSGIAIAGFVSIPVHNWICGLQKPCHR